MDDQKDVVFGDIFWDLAEVTPLHVSIRSGNKEEFAKRIQEHTEQLTELGCVLHSCVHKSYYDTEEVIINKIEMIKTLISLDKSYLEEKDRCKRTPLLMDAVHYKLLESLISEGANVFAKSVGEKQTVAHCAARYLNADEYHDLVVLLIEKNKTKVFTAKDRFNRTPVHEMLYMLEVREETLCLLSQGAKLTFNSEDSFLYTEFFEAIRGGHGQQILKCLINLGAEWDYKNKCNTNALHVACESDNADAVCLLLSFGVNAKEVSTQTL